MRILKIIGTCVQCIKLGKPKNAVSRNKSQRTVPRDKRLQKYKKESGV